MGAVLEVGRVEMDDALVAEWRRNVTRARWHLGWDPEAACVARRHASGVSLAIAAPLDQLFTATELNEWALCVALHDRDPTHWAGLRDALRAYAEQSGPSPSSAFPAEIERHAALARLTSMAAQERRPGLLELVREAQARRQAVIVRAADAGPRPGPHVPTHCQSLDGARKRTLNPMGAAVQVWETKVLPMRNVYSKVAV